MNTELLLLLYREMYDEELVRSDGFRAGALLPIGGILVLLMGGVLYHVYNLPWTTDWRWFAAIVVALGLAVASTVVAVWYLVRAQRDSRCKFLPNPEDRAASEGAGRTLREKSGSGSGARRGPRCVPRRGVLAVCRHQQ